MAVDSESALAGSLTDLMTSLMVIFVLLLVAMLNSAHHQGQSSRDDLLRSLREALSTLGGQTAGRVQVVSDPGDPLGLIIYLPQKLLNFGFAQDTIPLGGKAFLATFVPKLADVVCSPRFRNEIGSVTIQGQTDPRGAYSFNVGLGQDRATAVAVASLGDLGPGVERDCFEDILTAGGRGNSNRSSSLPSEAVMATERRVEFRVRVRSAEERNFQETVPVN